MNPSQAIKWLIIYLHFFHKNEAPVKANFVIEQTALDLMGRKAIPMAIPTLGTTIWPSRTSKI